jgi:pyruvate-ferredoxin/flavodoxin oxidoreductase
MKNGLEQQKLAALSGVWPLYRYNPDNLDEGKNPLMLDSKDPTLSVKDYAYKENRYRMLVQSDESRAEVLMEQAEANAKTRWELYKQMAAVQYSKPEESQQ